MKRAAMAVAFVLLMAWAAVAQKSGGGSGGGISFTVGDYLVLAGSVLDVDTSKILTRPRAQSGADLYVTLSSSDPTTFVGAITDATLEEYTDGMVVQFRPNDTCTGSPTLNIDTLGAVSLVEADGTTALACTDGQQVALYYDEANSEFVRQGAAASGPQATWVITPTQGPALSTTSYISSSLAPSGTEAGRYWVSGVTGTIRNLRVGTLTGLTLSDSCVCTVRVAGIDSSVTITLPATTTAGTIYSDTSNSAAVTAGDKVTLKCVNAASAAAPTFTATMEVY